MKKFFLLLSLAAGSMVIFYFLLVSFSRFHPMGLGRVVILTVFGIAGLGAFCEAFSAFYDDCRTALAQWRLRHRLQSKEELFKNHCRTL